MQFFIRPTNGRRELTTEELPRPTERLTGAYLFERDGTVYSTYGGLKSWNPKTRTWNRADGAVGTHETMRVGNGTLSFGDSRVTWNDRTILEPPRKGSYQLFFYANGHLCFYHVNRGDGQLPGAHIGRAHGCWPAIAARTWESRWKRPTPCCGNCSGWS